MGQRDGREERQAGGEGARWERGYEAPWEGHHSLQFISSEASSQSTNWLQRLEFPMQVPSRQRNSPTPQAVSRTAPAPRPSGHSFPSPGQETPGQGSWPKAPAQAHHGTRGSRPHGAWGPKPGQSGARWRQGSKRQAAGPTHCCRESRPSRPRSRPPRCTTACWTHSARCCTGGKSSCSGVSLRTDGEWATGQWQ